MGDVFTPIFVTVNVAEVVPLLPSTTVVSLIENDAVLCALTERVPAASDDAMQNANRHLAINAPQRDSEERLSADGREARYFMRGSAEILWHDLGREWAWFL